MSTEVEETRYWCHVCNAEVPVVMAPDLTCQYCTEQFLEEVQSVDDPREFFDNSEPDVPEPRYLSWSSNPTTEVNQYYIPSRDGNGSPIPVPPPGHLSQSVQGEVGDDMFQYFTPPSRNNDNNNNNRTRASNPRVRSIVESLVSDILGPEFATPDNIQSLLVTGNLPSRTMPGTMPTSERYEMYSENLRAALNQSMVAAELNQRITLSAEDVRLYERSVDHILSRLLEQYPHTPMPTPNSIIDSFVRRSLNEQEIRDQRDCIICQEEFPEKVVELPCKHIFHDECIRTWLQINRTCPVCRGNVIPGEGDGSPPSETLGDWLTRE